MISKDSPLPLHPQALFEYLLIVTGAKNGGACGVALSSPNLANKPTPPACAVDPSSPYQSLAQALLDSVCRKVGSVLQVGSAALAEDDE